MLCLARASYILQVTLVAAVSVSHITMSVIKTLTTIAVRTLTGKGNVACEESQRKAVGEVCASQEAKTTSGSLTDSSMTEESPAPRTTTLAITIFLNRCITKIVKSPRLPVLKTNLRI